MVFFGRHLFWLILFFEKSEKYCPTKNHFIFNFLLKTLEIKCHAHLNAYIELCLIKPKA